MTRWQGRWLVWSWLLLPGILLGQEPLLIPRAADPTADSTFDAPLPLSRPAANSAHRLAGSSKSAASKSPTGWGTVTGSLLVVLGMIVAGGYFLSRKGIRLPGMLPADVVQILGKRYLDARSSLQLVRCGSKILVLANSSQHGLRTLSEITDPHEVELLTEQCQPTVVTRPKPVAHPPNGGPAGSGGTRG